MKITQIEIYRFSIPMEPFVIATGTMDYAQNTLIKITTNNNIIGYGECSAFPMIVGETQDTCLAMAKYFAPMWIGKNPLEIPERMEELHAMAAGNGTIKSAFDMALFDIAAKNAELPLYKFLGGTQKSVTTDMTIGIGKADEMAELAKKYVSQGCTILKIKLGKDVHEDIVRIEKIRTAVGPDIKIRLDANQGWSFDDALYGLGEMGKYDIEFCEQPMRTWYDDLLPELCANSPIKIMADESCYLHHDARKLINAQATDYINIKFAKCGGILEAIKILDVATQHGVKCMMGGMLESRLAASAFLHLSLASPNIQFYDMDTCMLGHLVDPIEGGLSYAGYDLSISDAPGIGATVKEDFLVGCEKWTIV